MLCILLKFRNIPISGSSRRRKSQRVPIKRDSVNYFSDSSDSDSPERLQQNVHLRWQQANKYKHSSSALTRKYSQGEYVYPTPSRDSPRSAAERRLTFDSSDEFDSPQSFLSLKSNRSTLINSSTTTPKRSPGMTTPKRSSAATLQLPKAVVVTDRQALTPDVPNGSDVGSTATDRVQDTRNHTGMIDRFNLQTIDANKNWQSQLVQKLCLYFRLRNIIMIRITFIIFY